MSTDILKGTHQFLSVKALVGTFNKQGPSSYCATSFHIDVEIVELYKKVCWLGGVTAECNQDDPALITADTTHTVSHVTRGAVTHYTLSHVTRNTQYTVHCDTLHCHTSHNVQSAGGPGCMFVLCTDPGLWSSVICGEMIAAQLVLHYCCSPGPATRYLVTRYTYQILQIQLDTGPPIHLHTEASLPPV